MGGLKKGSSNFTYVNIRQGQLVVKKDGLTENYSAISGIVRNVTFEEDEFEGKKYEVAKILIDSDGELFLLQMRIDSGYFRGFCNSIKSGNPLEEVEIVPSYKKGDKGTTQTTCFINQKNKSLKHFHTKDNMGDLPLLKSMQLKGNTVWDNSEQIAYWKNWLRSIYDLSIEEPIEDKEDIPF
jgi:hypothetical protein